MGEAPFEKPGVVSLMACRHGDIKRAVRLEVGSSSPEIKHVDRRSRYIPNHVLPRGIRVDFDPLFSRDQLINESPCLMPLVVSISEDAKLFVDTRVSPTAMDVRADVVLGHYSV